MQTSDVRALIKNIMVKGGVRKPRFIQKGAVRKVNPLRNKKVMLKLNPAFNKLKKKRVVNKARALRRASPGTALYAALEARGLFRQQRIRAKTAARKAAWKARVRAEGKNPKAEVKKPKAEVKKPKTEVKKPVAKTETKKPVVKKTAAKKPVVKKAAVKTAVEKK